MKVEQRKWTKESGWGSEKSAIASQAQLVFAFGETDLMKQNGWLDGLKNLYPNARILGCSTAGEILGTNVYENAIAATAVHFSKTSVKWSSRELTRAEDSKETGEKLAASLDPKGLSHVLVLSVGLNVNGSELVRGLTAALPKGVAVTGGLAGDQARFQETLVATNEGVSNTRVTVVGLYGKAIRVGTASLGGWDTFGPERKVTKVSNNVLFELDGQPALTLYKTYLGEHAKELPGSALKFPLCLKLPHSTEPLVRTVLAVDEKTGSMTFAGDIPQGATARFMKANVDRLVEGATGAAENSIEKQSQKTPSLALLISCVGRKLVMKQRVEEEIESVRNVFGTATQLMGFYSYGEISPFTPSAKCELHNQTMTITTLFEDEKAAA